MSTRSPAFRFYPSDFMGSPDVQAMELHEVGAYVFLLCTAWQAEPHGYLPDDDDRLRRWARMSHEQWSQSRDLLLGKFPVAKPGWRANPRMVHEAEKQAAFNESQREKINKRWDAVRVGNPSGNTEDIPSVSKTDTRASREPYRRNDSGNTETIPPVSDEDTGVIPSVSVSVSAFVSDSASAFVSDFDKDKNQNKDSSNSKSSTLAKPKTKTDKPSSAAPTQAASSSQPTESGDVSGDDDFELLPENQPPDQSTPAERRAIDGVIESMFRLYCQTFARDPKRYTLTPKRKIKGLLRLKERIKATGSLPGAIQDFTTAIANLAASEYHQTNGFIDWTDHICRSAEMFEKRLLWKAPAPASSNGGGNHVRSQFESVDEHNERVANAAIQRLRGNRPTPA